MTNEPVHQRSRWRSLPTGVWALGLVSLLMDTSSELVYCLLPLFLSTVLGASTSSIGLIEGVAEGATSVMKVYSGALSDRLRRRKGLVVLGYALAALSKFIFPLASSLTSVFVARLTDRIGKGIRGAPRDALIADITSPAARGAAFGLRQALDSAGAFLGPALAIFFMAQFANNLKAVLWIAVAPALTAVLLLVVAVREPGSTHTISQARRGISLVVARQLSGRYWIALSLGVAFSLARFSDAFLVLRARNVGLTLGHVPWVMVVMNVVYAIAAYPAGLLADRIDRDKLLFCGLMTLVAADAVLAVAATPEPLLAGAALWGLQMALTQGLMSKLVADSAPAEIRGLAFGLFYLASGAATLGASTVAGVLWDTFGPSATFCASAGFAALCIAVLALHRYLRPQTRAQGIS